MADLRSAVLTRRFSLATRIYAPEAAAAAFRLERLVQELSTVAEVDVLTVRAPQGEHRPPPRVRVRRWPVLRDGDGYVRGYLPYLSFDLPLLLRLLLHRRDDAVIVEPPPTTGAVVRLVSAIRRRPYVWYAADVWSDAAAVAGSPAVVVRALAWLESWVIRGAATCLAVSDGVAQRVRDLGGEQVAVVGNGVDTDTFGLDGERVGDQTTFVYAGTASEWQGAEIFAQAMTAVLQHEPHARLVYLGHGSAHAQIEAIAADLPDGAITVLGNVPAAECATWLRGAAGAVVSIVPGKGYDFAIPTKVFAALGTGTPVLYAGTGPVVGILADAELGTAVGYDVDAVAAAMIGMLVQAQQDAGSDTGQARARARHAWVEEHRSLAAVARRAAEAVLATVPPRPGR